MQHITILQNVNSPMAWYEILYIEYKTRNNNNKHVPLRALNFGLATRAMIRYYLCPICFQIRKFSNDKASKKFDDITANMKHGSNRDYHLNQSNWRPVEKLCLHLWKCLVHDTNPFWKKSFDIDELRKKFD